MVQVTPQAARHLVQVRNERGLSEGAGARFVPKGQGVGMTFSGQPQPGDAVVVAEEIKIYVAPEIAAKLDRSTIDVAETNGKTGLVLRPPRTAATQG